MTDMLCSGQGVDMWVCFELYGFGYGCICGFMGCSYEFGESSWAGEGDGVKGKRWDMFRVYFNVFRVCLGGQLECTGLGLLCRWVVRRELS